MKNIFPRIASLLLVSFALTIAIAAQQREITEAEFESLKASAKAKAENTYPRILTKVEGKSTKYESTSVTKYETSSRKHTKVSRLTSTGEYAYESVSYDGKSYDRTRGGVWESVVIGVGDFTNRGAIIEKMIYTLEVKSDSKSSYSILAKQEIDKFGAIYLWWSRIDSSGRMIEYSDKTFGSDDSGKYEFPEKLDPIKKPKLGTKEDI